MNWFWNIWQAMWRLERKFRPNRKTQTLGIFLLCFLLYAIIWIIIGILCIVVAAYIICRLIEFIHQYISPPPNPQGATNNMTATWSVTNSDNPTGNLRLSAAIGQFIPIQFGIDDVTNGCLTPWLITNNLLSNSISGLASTNTDDPALEFVSLTQCGWTWEWYISTDDASIQWQTNYTPFDSVIHVQKTTNGKDWFEVYEASGVNTVMEFDDYDIQPCNIYRVMCTRW